MSCSNNLISGDELKREHTYIDLEVVGVNRYALANSPSESPNVNCYSPISESDM